MGLLTATYSGPMRVTCRHEESGAEISTIAPAKDGTEQGFSPTDLCAASLGMCAMTLMALMGERHNIDLSGMKVDMEKTMGTDPSRISQIKITFHMPKREYSEKDRARLERAINICPIHSTLAPEVEQIFDIRWPK